MLVRRWVVGVLVTCLTGCTPLITSSGDYRTAGARTAGDASAQVGSVLLAVDLSEQGRAPKAYLSVVVGDAEAALNGIASTFGGLQPPRPEDVPVRDEVLDPVSRAQEDAAAVRIALGQSQPPPETSVVGLRAVQDELDRLAGELQ